MAQLDESYQIERWGEDPEATRRRAASKADLEAGKAADFAVWDIARPAELAYRIGFNPLAYAVKGGTIADALPDVSSWLNAEVPKGADSRPVLALTQLEQ